MGTSHSSFNKANFKRGIRGYRQMFASLHLEQKELKKLWIEFGKIDTDNGGTVSIRELLTHCDLDFTPFAYRLFSIFDEDSSGAVDFREFVLSTWNCCTMDHDALIRFAFDLFDGDHSGAIETKEMEAMLGEVYGESFVDSPTAAFTLKRVKELSLQSQDTTPTKQAPVPTKPKDGLQLDAAGRVYAMSFEAFREFCRQHAGMLLPAFTLQRKIRSKIVSESFWKGCAERRNGGRLGGGKGKKLKHPPRRKPINLEELTTMIRINEASETGTTTDQGMAKNGSRSGAAATTPPDRGNREPPAKSPATASPSPAPGLLETTTAGGVRGDENDAHNHSDAEASSPKAPATVPQGGDRKEDGSPNSSGAKKRISGPQREGEENHKRGGDGGIPLKRGSGARGVVAVEEADRVGVEAGTGAPPEKVPKFSMQVSRGGHGKLASHAHAAQPEVLPKTGVDTEPPKRKPRQSYPVPVDAGGRGVSAWARGGDDGGLDVEVSLPHFQGVGGEQAGVAARRKVRESKVDSPAMAAAKAAAVYDLPALRETGAQKRSSHQARELVAGGGVRGGRAHRSSARPLSASPDARNRRRETGQAAAAASAAAKNSAASGTTSPGGGHPIGRTAMDVDRENAHGVGHDHRRHHPPEQRAKRGTH